MPPHGDRSILQDGERILLIDAKERRYLINLRAGASFHTHVGIVAHDSAMAGGKIVPLPEFTLG